MIIKSAFGKTSEDCVATSPAHQQRHLGRLLTHISP